MSATERLEVYLANKHLGELIPSRSGMRFRYDDSVCAASMGAPLLSTALPVRPEPYDSLLTKNWFSGLLPEDARLEEVARYFGVAGGGYEKLLQEIGWECAGAVSVYPAGRGPSMTDEGNEILWIEMKSLAERLSYLPAHPFDNASTLRVSLGGFQEKMSVIMPGDVDMAVPCIEIDKVGLSIDGTPTTHILKPQPIRFPGMVEGEAWAMTAASAATEAARVSLLRIDGAPITLVVERYDRRCDKGTLMRVHQEDCVQALGLEPSRKYATVSSPKKSDPSFGKIAELLKKHAENPHLEMVKLLRQMVVNVALGNTDAHAKNFALLHVNEAVVKMSPLYDVVPAREITPQVLNMGMRIAGQIKIDRVTRNEVVQEARTWGLAVRLAERVLNETLEALSMGVEKANERYPGAGAVHAAPAMERIALLA